MSVTIAFGAFQAISGPRRKLIGIRLGLVRRSLIPARISCWRWARVGVVLARVAWFIAGPRQRERLLPVEVVLAAIQLQGRLRPLAPPPSTCDLTVLAER